MFNRGGAAALHFQDLRAVLRLVRETSELKASSLAAARDYFLTEASRLADAKLAIVLHLHVDERGLLQLSPRGWRGWTGEEDAVFREQLRTGGYRQSPFFQHFPAWAAGVDDIAACLRRHLVPDRAWYASAYVERTLRQLGIDDVVMAVTPAGPEQWHALAFARPWGEARRFAQRERVLATALLEPAVALFSVPEAAGGWQGRQELPGRLREVRGLLLSGLGEKQIAARLGISQHTVHRHVNRLYELLRVGSRAQLLALHRPAWLACLAAATAAEWLADSVANL